MNTRPVFAPPLQAPAIPLSTDPQAFQPREVPPELLAERERLQGQQATWKRLTEPKADFQPPAPDPDAVPTQFASDRARSDWDNKRASDLTDGQFDKLFGSDALKMKDLATHRPDLTVHDLSQLHGDPDGLAAVSEMLYQRPDLNMTDVSKRDMHGNLMIDPSIEDENSKKLLLDRNDIKPLQLTTMGANFSNWLHNPGLARDCYDHALSLLHERRSVQPRELEQMMGSMMMSIGGQQSKTPQGAAAVADMFNNSCELLKKRPDLKPHDMGEMARDVGRLQGKQAGDRGPQLVAEAFHAGTDVLARAPHLNTQDIGAAAGVMRKHFVGEDAQGTEDRVHAFELGINMMADTPGVKAQHLDQMLTRAKQNQPGLQGINLLNAFEGMHQAVGRGQANMNTLTDLSKPKGAQGDLVVDKFGHAESQQQPQLRPQTPPAREGRPQGPARGRQPQQPQPGQGPRGPIAN